jgi:hypothetical protein
MTVLAEFTVDRSRFAWLGVRPKVTGSSGLSSADQRATAARKHRPPRPLLVTGDVHRRTGRAVLRISDSGDRLRSADDFIIINMRKAIIYYQHAKSVVAQHY